MKGSFIKIPSFKYTNTIYNKFKIEVSAFLLAFIHSQPKLNMEGYDDTDVAEKKEAFFRS